MQKMMSKPIVLWAGLLISAWSLLSSCTRDVPQLDLPGVRIMEQPIPLQPFRLLDQDSQIFTNDNMKGKWTLAFFGYTHCPDICPNTMLVMNAVHKQLSTKPGFEDTRYIFFSVDPYRDKPEKLKDFVAYFNKQFLGVTGKTEELRKLTDLVGAFFDYSNPHTDEVFQDVSTAPPIPDYLVNHAASVYLFDDKGHLAAYVMPPHDVDKIIAVYSAFRS